jgi:PiT family inorganic phosphate transporter
MPLDALTLTLIVLTLAFTFLNGYNDSGALVATMIASGALTARKALALAAACELLGPLLLGVAVASTIGRGIVVPEVATRGTFIAALLGAGAWGLLAGRLGVPTSATHALVGGLVGAALVGAGPSAIVWRGVAAVAIALGLAPLLGLLCGYLYMKAMLAVGVYLTPAINPHLRRLQIVTSALVALSHGANDAQKGMGLITAGLVAAGALDAFVVPGWVILACASAIALGVALGGQRTLRTLGMRIYTIRPLHGFAAQATSGLIVIGASLLGGPASTTQVATSAIFGVGAAERVTKVRWEVGQSILVAWLVTVPVAALASAIVRLAGLALQLAA